MFYSLIEHFNQLLTSDPASTLTAMEKRPPLPIIFWRLLTTLRNWPVYFLCRIGSRRDRLVEYRFWNGLRVRTRGFAIDRSPINDVWIDRAYEPTAYDIPFTWADCHTIVDIGANIGVFTLYAAKKAPTARLFSVEPDPQTAEVLRDNIHINGLDARATVRECGVSGEAGELPFYVSDKCSRGNSLYQYTADSHAITVPVIPLQQLLDDWKLEQIDFLKMDCEGAEYDALYRLPDSYFQHIRFLAIEYHHFSKEPSHSPSALRSFLEKQGYTITEPHNSIFYARRADAL